MKKTPLPLFGRGGWILLGAILAIGGGWLALRQLTAPSSTRATVLLHSQPVGSIPLAGGAERWYHLDPDSGRLMETDSASAPEEGILFHLFSDGSVCFESSDCPDRLCVQKGRLSLAGDVAVCLPNGVVLRLEGEGDHPDVIV
ncbi:MAG: NusG domain II-containing protein [Oscillospiraceae bacterium]|nr:NusG domain II-containing protein [Oscillospiraceae bacterium]